MKKRTIKATAAVIVASLVIYACATNPRPRLSYIGRSVPKGSGIIPVEYELRNRSLLPIYYEGYSPDWPLYRISYRTNETWNTPSGGWLCGTGVEARRLAPGKSVTITVDVRNIDTARVFRVGVPYYRLTWRLPHYWAWRIFKKDLDPVVWSEQK